MARHVRKRHAGKSAIDVDQSFVDEYQVQFSGQVKTYQNASEVLGHYYQGPPACRTNTLNLQTLVPADHEELGSSFR
eukprot:12907452-Prorocentrum_lima.AAC.1